MTEYLKMQFDSSNLIRQKAYQEYQGVKSFSQYIQTSHGINKLKKLVERYFTSTGLEVKCLDIEIDLLKHDEIIIVLENNNYSYAEYNNGHIYFY